MGTPLVLAGFFMTSVGMPVPASDAYTLPSIWGSIISFSIGWHIWYLYVLKGTNTHTRD